MKREELSAALKKALKIPGMQTHINRKTAAWRLIHKRDGLKGIYNPTIETVYEWAKGKVASILYIRLHQKSLEELYEMFVCGMTAGEMNLRFYRALFGLDEVQAPLEVVEPSETKKISNENGDKTINFILNK
jgi:hypothetical protein